MPLETSTAKGATFEMASRMFSGTRPPARIMGVPKAEA